MIKFYYRLIAIFIFSVFLINSCYSKKENEGFNTDEVKILKVHDDYVNGWLKNDEEKVMELLEENARIQPNRLKPIEGKSEIRMFWFPKDSSTTIINHFETELLILKIMDTIAITTHKSLLNWSYSKDTTQFGMLQRGVNTSVYRKQPDKTWKIWRQMWTDIYAKSN